jgi:tRNA (guanine37-N1)-methyltransferase
MHHMKFHFLTIFPEMIGSYINESILKRAKEQKLVDFSVVNIRDHSKDRHHKTDDRPYGGGPGMVMTAEPLLRAYAKLKFKGKKVKVVQLTPSGKEFTNVVAKKFAKQYSDIVFICGRYEGVDDRVRKILKADEYSIGNYTLTGGELPALSMTDAIARQIKGVLGDHESVEENRTASPRVYTRPEVLEWKGKKYKVPPVLLSGDHKKIEAWRKNQKG